MFAYDKDNLFKEFNVAQVKDIKLSKRGDRYDNRIQFFKDHIDLKSKHPEYYRDVDIKFDRLLTAYQSPNPRDHFYMSIFGKTYAEKKAESQFEPEKENSKN